ncbi:hypothetical protein [Egbenema bharatensis]|uniref:hypothetical protein n=1 Tax=Egbenema bharatensis TaxID=3463334 RepID=UPI003A8812BF
MNSSLRQETPQTLDVLDASTAQTVQSRDVAVKILLAGGYEYSLTLKSDAALLRSLIGAFLARTQGKTENFLFQIPIDDGQSSLCFTSEHLVGLITNPPLMVRRQGNTTDGTSSLS